MLRFLTSLIAIAAVGCSGGAQRHEVFDEPPSNLDDGSVDAGTAETPGDASTPPIVEQPDAEAVPWKEPPIIIGLPNDDSFDEDATVDDALDGQVAEPTRLLDANGVLLGMTSDDRIVFRDTNGVWTIKAAPGAPRRMVASKAGTLYVRGKTIFNFTDVNWTTARGKLTIWSPGVGRRSVAEALQGDNTTDARADGKYVLLATNLKDDTLDILVAPSHLATAQVLVQGAGRGSESTCRPRYGFAGESVIVVACVPGSAIATLDRFTVDESGVWQKETIAPRVQPHWAADSAGQRIFFIDEAAHAYIAQGSDRTEVDRNVIWGRLDAEGSTIFYTVGDQLRLKGLEGQPIPIVTTGFIQSVEWSQDLTQVVYSRVLDYEHGSRRDLLVTATNWFNPEPYVLVDQPVATLSRSTLTSDGQYVLYLTDVQLNGVGTLNISPVSRAAGRTFAAVDTAVAGSGSVIVFSNNRSEAGVWPVVMDLNVIDASQDQPPQLLQSGVLDGRTFQVTADKTKVVYIRARGAGSEVEGIYVHPISATSAQ